MNSNEMESLQFVLDMLGGSDEYKGAVLVAALCKTFKNSVNYLYITKGEKTFNILMEVGHRNLTINATFNNSYFYLFEDSAK